MRLVIKLSGGLVEEVVQEDGQAVQIIVLDDDIEEADDDNLFTMGGTQFYVDCPTIFTDNQIVNNVFQKLWEELCA
jgi:hypothetical protein